MQRVVSEDRSVTISRAPFDEGGQEWREVLKKIGSASGVYLHHGNWEGRTRRPPPNFWKEVSRSGVGTYYLTQPPEGLREGTLSQLPKGDRGAFDAVVRQIHARVDGGKSRRVT